MLKNRLRKTPAICIAVRISAVSIAALSFIRCVDVKLNKKCFEDYSIINGEGIFCDSSTSAAFKVADDIKRNVREIFPLDNRKEYIDRILEYRTDKGDVYEVKYKHPRIGGASNFFFVVKNDSLFRYTIISEHSDSIIMALNVIHELNSFTYHITVKKSDTVKFINKIFEFKDYYSNRLNDSVFIKLKHPINTLNNFEL